MNSLGKTVCTEKVKDPMYKIDVSNWGGEGLYILHLYNDTGTLITVKKIIVQ